MPTANTTPTNGSGAKPINFDLEALAWDMLKRWKLLGSAAVGAGVLAFAASYLIPPTFVSTTTFLPPQQQQSAAASALSSLGALAGLAGGGALKATGDQYIAFMQSVTVQDRIIDRFKLMDVYEAKLRHDARLELSANVKISLGKKDGLVSITVEDKAPQRAAEIANRYVEELRVLSSSLAVTEAQQRRVFFEGQWSQVKAQLIKAQQALEGSGFNPSALKAEPKAAAEAYAQLRAELSTAEIKLRALRTTMADGAPEVLQLASMVSGLRERLGKLEASEGAGMNNADYVSRFREFKYQETMFELMAKQYELARVDEAREGALIQVVDPALPAERKFKPKRSVAGLLGAALGVLIAAAWVARTQFRTAVSRGR